MSKSIKARLTRAEAKSKAEAAKMDAEIEYTVSDMAIAALLRAEISNEEFLELDETDTGPRRRICDLTDDELCVLTDEDDTDPGQWSQWVLTTMRYRVPEGQFSVSKLTSEQGAVCRKIHDRCAAAGIFLKRHMNLGEKPAPQQWKIIDDTMDEFHLPPARWTPPR